jgi:hypothetical protein
LKHRGSFVHGEKNGFGCVTWKNSDSEVNFEFKGGFFKGLKQGIGVEVRSRKPVYIGEFSDD